jgi:hypothetical protein
MEQRPSYGASFTALDIALYSIALPTWLTIAELWFFLAALARWGGRFSGLPGFAVEPWAGRRA